MFRTTEAQNIRQKLDQNQYIENGIISRFNKSSDFLAFVVSEAENVSYGREEYRKINDYPCEEKLATITEIIYEIQADKFTSREIVTDQILSNLICGLQGFSDEEISNVASVLGEIYDLEL